MERKEKTLHIVEIVLGAIAAGLLITILVLKILQYDVMFLTYPLVGVVAAFLIVDECARALKRKRLKAEAEAEQADAEPEPAGDAMPKEAFEFEEKEP